MIEEYARSKHLKEPKRENLALSRPMLILITGAGGTGKSSLINGLFVGGVKVAKGLTELLPHAYVVNKDQIADGLTLSRGADYEIAAREETYRRVFDRAELGLRIGATVIVDASHKSQITTPGWETPYRQIAEQNSAEIKIIRLITPIETIRDRLIARKSSYDAHKPLGSVEELDHWHRENEPIETPMPYGTLMIDSSQDFNEVVRQALEYITANQKPLEKIDVKIAIAQLKQLARPINDSEKGKILKTLRSTPAEIDDRRAESTRQQHRANPPFHALQDIICAGSDVIREDMPDLENNLLSLQSCFLKDLELYLTTFPPEEAEMRGVFETILEVGTTAYWYEDLNLAEELCKLYEELDKTLIKLWMQA